MNPGRSRLQGFHPEVEFRSTIQDFRKLIEHPNLDRRLLMALTAAVQKLVDEVRHNSDLVKSHKAADEVRATQLADLKAQVATLQAGQAIGADDLAAITASVDQIVETNASLVEAVPANTPADPGVAPVDASPPVADPAPPSA